MKKINRALVITVILLILTSTVSMAAYTGPGNRATTTHAWQRRFCAINVEIFTVWRYDRVGRYFSPASACPDGPYIVSIGADEDGVDYAWVSWGDHVNLGGSFSGAEGGSQNMLPNVHFAPITNRIESCTSGQEGCTWTTIPITYDPASVSGTNSCTETGNNGWCTGDATLSLSSTEPYPGQTITAIETASQTLCTGSSCTYTYPQGVSNLTYWAVSSLGDTSLQASSSMSVDSVPPTASVSVSGTLTNGWYNNANHPTLTANGTDATSGIDTLQLQIDGGSMVSSPLTYSTEGVHTVVSVATDLAGLTTTSIPTTLQLDNTNPTATVSVSHSPVNGWYAQPIQITVSGSDALSGFDRTTYSLTNASGTSTGTAPLTLSTDGMITVILTSYDEAGNNISETRTYRLDRTAPSISFTSTGQIGEITFNGNSSDATSGIDRVQFSRDGGNTWEDVSVESDGSWTATANTLEYLTGKKNFMARAYDNAGNENTSSLEFNIANAETTLSLPGSWLVSQSGKLTINKGDVETDSIKVTICDEKGQYACVDKTYLSGQEPEVIKWDGYFGTQLAHSGEYPVTVELTDQSSRKSYAYAVIIVPTILPTSTPAPKITEIATEAPTELPEYYGTEVPPAITAGVVDTSLTEDAPVQVVKSQVKFKTAPYFILMGFLGVFGVTALTDPRPAQIERVAKAIAKNNEEKEKES